MLRLRARAAALRARAAVYEAEAERREMALIAAAPRQEPSAASGPRVEQPAAQDSAAWRTGPGYREDN